MFEHIINAFESVLVATVIFFLCKQKKATKIKYLFSLCFIILQFCFLTLVNLVSMTESIFMAIEIMASYAFASLISFDSPAHRFFICAVPYNVIGIENTIQNTTISYLLFHKIDYLLLADKYRIPNVIFSQIIHVLLLYYIVKVINKTEQVIKDNDYYLLGIIFFVCNFMTLCFETLGYHFENQDLFMIFGIYSVVLFIILIIHLFKSIYQHSVYETKQQIELDILENQQASNKKILEAQSDLYKLRHDMKHFFQALNNPNIVNSETKLQAVIDQYEFLVKNITVPITTVSPAVNYVLNIKKEEAVRKGIDFSSVLNITSEINMDDSDLYLLLSNLLDNAIEHIGIEKKIKVEMNYVGKMFAIKITNSIDRPVLNEKGDFIFTERGLEHGYGIKTIDSIISKYDGFVSYTEEEKEFFATVMIKSSI